jgi:hypothetical protein
MQAIAPDRLTAPGRLAATTSWRGLRKAALAALALLLASAAWQCRAQPVAVVIDGGGTARVFAATGARSVQTLELLSPGTRLQIDAVAQIVVLYLASGVEFSFTGPGVIEVGSAQLIGLSGNPPVARTPTPGKEIRLRTQRTAQGGVVLRSVAADSPSPAAAAGSVDLDARRPAADAPLASWVAYALWLDENNAGSEAKAVWRRLASERPSDPALAQRAL